MPTYESVDAWFSTAFELFSEGLYYAEGWSTRRMAIDARCNGRFRAQHPTVPAPV